MAIDLPQLRANLGTQKTAPTACPVCFVVQTAATCATDHGAKPKAGDVTVCIDCGARLTFTEALTLRPMTTEERTALFRQNPQHLEFLDAAHRKFSKGRTP